MAMAEWPNILRSHSKGRVQFVSESAKGVALVTGAGRRIGRAIALDLGAAGFDVAVHYNRSMSEAEDTASEIRKLGRNAISIQTDLADASACVDLIPKATAELGSINVLINNASTFERDDVGDLTTNSWDTNLNVNLRAPMLLMKALADTVGPDRNGNIINIIDQKVWQLTPFYLSYTIAKSGLWTLTQTMAQALAPNIRVNGIGPGPVAKNDEMTEEDFQERCRAMPLGIGASFEDLCDGVRYLLNAKSMTGQMIALDGGQHLMYPRIGRVAE
jgi:NAD(P)-dependent dehydrogenase (short-subunit alcohol dehydrogenase family)